MLTWVFAKVWNCLCPDHNRGQIIPVVVDSREKREENTMSHVKSSYTHCVKVLLTEDNGNLGEQWQLKGCCKDIIKIM